MSGTSLDGADAVLVDFSGAAPRILASATVGFEPALRAELLALNSPGADEIDRAGRAGNALAEAYARAVLAVLSEAGAARESVRAIGCHGQTVRHRPERGYTVQIGNPARLAERTGIAVVADFRGRDLAAGGQGAPLVPAFHAAVFGDEDPSRSRAVLNVGGIANLTLLPARGDVRGFDTGPANGLMDAWCLRHTGHAYDAGGALARQGRVDPALLARLLAEPWFAAPPPKSTGRDQFHLDWVEAALAGDEAAADVQATLLALTARTVANALHATQPATSRVIVCGGGVHNPLLMAALADAISAATVESSAVHGLDPDAVEAMAFAWLAREHLAGRPGNLPAVTGAAGPRVLGALYPA